MIRDDSDEVIRVRRLTNPASETSTPSPIQWVPGRPVLIALSDHVPRGFDQNRILVIDAAEKSVDEVECPGGCRRFVVSEDGRVFVESAEDGVGIVELSFVGSTLEPTGRTWDLRSLVAATRDSLVVTSMLEGQLALVAVPQEGVGATYMAHLPDRYGAHVWVDTNAGAVPTFALHARDLGGTCQDEDFLAIATPEVYIPLASLKEQVAGTTPSILEVHSARWAGGSLEVTASFQVCADDDKRGRDLMGGFPSPSRWTLGPDFNWVTVDGPVGQLVLDRPRGETLTLNKEWCLPESEVGQHHYCLLGALVRHRGDVSETLDRGVLDLVPQDDFQRPWFPDWPAGDGLELPRERARLVALRYVRDKGCGRCEVTGQAAYLDGEIKGYMLSVRSLGPSDGREPAYWLLAVDDLGVVTWSNEAVSPGIDEVRVVTGDLTGNVFVRIVATDAVGHAVYDPSEGFAGVSVRSDGESYELPSPFWDDWLGSVPQPTRLTDLDSDGEIEIRLQAAAPDAEGGYESSTFVWEGTRYSPP